MRPLHPLMVLLQQPNFTRNHVFVVLYSVIPHIKTAAFYYHRVLLFGLHYFHCLDFSYIFNLHLCAVGRWSSCTLLRKVVFVCSFFFRKKLQYLRIINTYWNGITFFFFFFFYLNVENKGEHANHPAPTCPVPKLLC